MKLNLRTPHSYRQLTIKGLTILKGDVVHECLVAPLFFILKRERQEEQPATDARNELDSVEEQTIQLKT